MRSKFYILSIYFLVQSFISFSQKYVLQILGNDSSLFIQKSGIKNTFSSYEDCVFELRNKVLQLQQKGYLECNIDSMIRLETYATSYIHVGDLYQWVHVKKAASSTAVWSAIGLDDQQFTNKPIQYQKFITVVQKSLLYLENNGYPFAQVYLDSVSTTEHNVEAIMQIKKGPFIKIDSIQLNEDCPVSKKYLQHYLQIKEGDAYNENAIRNISKRIRESAIISEQYPWRMKFSIDKNILTLTLKNKASNRADILIGLLPNNIENQGKFLLTGDVKLGVSNALSQGESFLFTWQNLQYKSPRLNIYTQYPYLLNTPIGIAATFDFYKKDTTFRTVHGELAIQYEIDAHKQLKLYYSTTSNRLLNVNSTSIKYTRQLPPNGDISSKAFGIEAIYNTTDNFKNPSNGVSLKIRTGIQIRNIIKNETVLKTYDVVKGETFGYLYDSIKLKNNSYQSKVTLSYYVKIKNRIVLATQYNIGIMYSTQLLYKNELYQLGGYRLLRGFDEGSIFAKNYHILTLEPRFITSENSYFFGFVDMGYIQQPFYTFKNETYKSVGAGLQFETKSGLFNMSVAIGSTSHLPFLIKQSKIHFGYINFF